MLSEAALMWLEARGLDAELASRLGLETVSRGAGDWLSLPYVRDGAVVNRKYRRLDEKQHSQDKGGVKCVWNEDCLRDKTLTGPVVITEGEWDAMAAMQAGYTRVVSVPDGAPAEAIGEEASAKYSYLPALIDLVRDDLEIIIAADGDDQGANLLADLSVRLGKARCKFLKYPKGCKDLGDALRQFGVKGVEKTLERASFVEVSGVQKLRNLAPEPPLAVYRPSLSDDVDRRLGICRGHFSVWTGIPGHGKSTLLQQVAFNLAHKEAWVIAVASFEGGGPWALRKHVASIMHQRPPQQVSESQWAEVDEFIDRHFVFIVPQRGEDLTLDWLLEKAEAAVVRFGASMLIVDPWNQLDHEYGADSETVYTSRCIKLLQRLGQRYHVHVAVVAHPKKMDTSTREKGRVPTGYDIAGSANWFNHPELGVTVHRDAEKGANCTMVRVWKSKSHEEMGPPGQAWLRFNSHTRTFYEWQDEAEAA